MAYSVVPLTLFGKTFGNATQGLGWLFAGPLSYPFMDPWYGLAYGGLLLLAGRTRFFVHRVLSHPILVRIGVISYSIYLLHTQVIYVAKRLLIRFIDSPNSYVRFAAAYGVIFPLILAVGYGFHMLVERRFLSGHARRETAAELHQPASPAALDATVPS
jgi:peptidoglycan/LPS O-acetylase OafA/YrhL